MTGPGFQTEALNEHRIQATSRAARTSIAIAVAGLGRGLALAVAGCGGGGGGYAGRPSSAAAPSSGGDGPSVKLARAPSSGTCSSTPRAARCTCSRRSRRTDERVSARACASVWPPLMTSRRTLRRRGRRGVRARDDQALRRVRPGSRTTAAPLYTRPRPTPPRARRAGPEPSTTTARSGTCSPPTAARSTTGSP